MTDSARTYFDFVEQELVAERARMASLDARSSSVVTSSVALAGLLGISGALATPGAARHNLASSAFLLSAIAAFALASALAAFSGRRRLYEVIASATLDDMISDEHWDDPDDTAQRAVTFVKVKTIRSIRISNKQRGRLLVAAMVAQLAALALIAAYAAVRILA